MATYTPIPKHVPMEQRSNIITNVAAGDQIDIIKVLGRPARRVQFILTQQTDVINYRLNNLVRIRKQRSGEGVLSVAERVYGTFGMEDAEVEVWNTGPGFPEYSSTGAVIIETAETLEVESIDMGTMTLHHGSVIEIVVW